jgi:hypothetical protein
METHFKRALWLFIFILSLASCQPAAAPTTATPLAAPAETRFIPQTAADVEPESTISAGDEALVPLSDLSYTEAEPLTDPEEILTILDALARRHIEWLSRPGWYVYRQYFTDVPDPHIRIWGTHFIDDLGDCAERFEFREEDGKRVPAWIALPDGTEAQLYSVDGELDHDRASVVAPEAGYACRMENDGYVYEVVHTGTALEMRFESVSAGALESYEVFLWKEVLQNREVIVLYESLKVPPSKGFHTLEDGTAVPIDRERSWTYRDPQTGGVMGYDVVTYGKNGEILEGAEKGVRDIRFSELAFYEELPPGLAQVYQKAVEALQAYMERGDDH